MRRRTFRGRKARLFIDIARGARDLIDAHPNAAEMVCNRIVDGLMRLENELEEEGRREERESDKREAAAEAKALRRSKS